MQTVFLNWNRPLLHLAADYLVERFSTDGLLDMRRVSLALPGRRATHRLEELLAERAASMPRPAWYPPEFLTLGHLPEKFYELSKPTADELTQCFAWLDAVDALQKENADQLATLLPNPPEPANLSARLALGKLLAKLHRELAADALDFSHVAKLCAKKHLDAETRRWQTLAALQKRYHDLLDSLDVWDVQSARLYAIKNQNQEEYDRILKEFEAGHRMIFLVGLVDMNQAQKAILNKFANFVTPLVFAPENLKQNFDEFGCLVPEKWHVMNIPLDEAQIELVDRPEDQADAVLRRMASLDQQFAGDEIVVGVPDSRVIPFLEQRFEQAGIESRHFEGTPTRRTVVFRFLDVLCKFLETKKGGYDFAALAELVRHPDVEAFLCQEFDVDLLSLLDRYHVFFLPETVSDDWRDEANVVTLQQIWGRLKDWLGADMFVPGQQVRKDSVVVQTQRVLDILARLYGDSEDKIVIETINQVRQATLTLQGIPAALAPRLTRSETLSLLLIQLESGNIPPHDKPGALEMIGWLELVMDDAPVVMVTGMNDGFVPSFLTADPFLPDKVRQELGIEDNQRRYARDAYALSAILGTRSGAGPANVTLIGGRQSTEGDPLLPSRLFFATDDLTVARRVRRFFASPEKKRELRLRGTMRSGESRSGTDTPAGRQDRAFKVPELEIPDEPPQSMRVTEFADYLKCPYRYFLKYQLRLETLHDDGEELDGGAFGNLVHETLDKFARSPLKNSDSADDIFGFLSGALGECSQKRFGNHPRSAVAIQIERALKRLEAFSVWQTDWRKKGWRIRDTEFAFNENSAGGRVFLDVDGVELFLRGRIDRIDVHEETGEIYVLDYKTSDTAVDPLKSYQKKNAEGILRWVDFQLPLYHYMMQRAERPGKISLGHIALPKDVTKTGLKPAGWTQAEIDEAVEEAREIVRQIRLGHFEKVDPPPPYSEAFAAICLDGVLTEQKQLKMSHNFEFISYET